MYVFAEPVTEEQIQKIQTTNQESIADFERRVLGLNDGDSTDDTSPADKASAKKEWAELQAKVAQQMDNDEMSSQENEAVRVVEVGTADGSLGDSGSTSESLEHPDAVTPDAADDGEQQSEQQAVSVAEERYDGVSSESHPSDPVAHQPGSNTKGAAPANLEANGEQYETEPTGGKETEGESYDADRMQEIEGAQKVAEMQENLLRVLNQSLSESERNPSEETEDSKTPGDTRFLDSNDEEQASVIPKGSDSSLLAMTLTIRNKVNGKYVLRPSNLAEDDNWSVEYSLAEVPTASRAWSLYGACQARRKARMDSSNTDNEDDAAANYYLRRMRDLSEKGREWRKVQDSIDQQNEKVVLGQSSPNDPVRRPHLAA